MGKRIVMTLLLATLAGGIPAWAAERATLNLKVGGSELVETVHPVRRATVANPEIADIVVLSPREFYAFAKRVGYTSVILWEEGGEGSGRTLFDVVVSLDLTNLKQKLHELFPREAVEVHASETGVVLTGTVSGPEVMEQILRLARTFLPTLAQGEKSGAAGTGQSGGGITNLLRVAEVQQVMLEVKFAEVFRDSDKDWKAALGIFDLERKLIGAAGTGILGVTSGGGLAQTQGSILLNFAGNSVAGNTANIFMRADNISAALDFLEREGLARTLAEPRLITLSGQEASFLAGGEFPVPVAQDRGEITIEFKDFGVALRFTPVVMSDGRIHLKVAPTVSEIASASTIPAGILGANFVVPNLTTRKLETTVELYDGQTLALAGLLQDSLREEVKKIPMLGDIPILGALFRSSSFRQDRTDLLIAVTPRLVKPSDEGVKMPGDGFRPPDPYEFYLEGRLEGDRDDDEAEMEGGETSAVDTAAADMASATVPPVKRGGLEGDFGHLEPR